MIRSALLSFTLLLSLSAVANSPEFLVGGATPDGAPNLRFTPAAASDGQDFFVVWNDRRTGYGAVIGTRVTREGRVLDPLGLRIATGTYNVTAPQVVWDGGAYLVVWSASSEPDRTPYLFAARIARDGTFATAPFAIADDANVEGGRYVASNGTISVIAYRNYNSQIAILALDGNGSPLHREILASDGDYRYEPVIAATATRFAVAWNANFAFSPETDEIHAVLLTADGHKLGEPVRVARGGSPAIGTDGTHFTITSRVNHLWQEYTLLSRTFDQNLAAVSPEHTLLVQHQIEHASVLWLGDHYEVVTARRVQNGQNELVTFELDRNGNPGPLRGRGILLGEILFLRLTAATNGTDVLVARAQDGPPQVGTQVFAQLYRGTSAVQTTAPVMLSWSGNAHRHPDIAASGAGHFVAWTEMSGVYGTRIDANGNSLDGRGIRLSTAELLYYEYYSRARVAFDGENYVVAWTELNHIGVRYVSPLTGATVAEARIEVFGRPALALATSPDATYLVYSAGRVRVLRIPRATHTPDPVALDVSPEDMLVDYPVAAWNGSELLVAWAQQYHVERADPPLYLSIGIHGARVSASLSLLDPSPIAIAPVIGNEEIGFEDYGPPSLASNGADWLVVAGKSTDVIARRVSRLGLAEGAAPQLLGAGADPVVAWDGERYAVAWKTGTYQDVARPLVLSAVPASGALVATNRSLVTSGTASSYVSVASAGNGHTSVAYTRISFLPEHAGIERSFFRVMDFAARRGRAIRR